MGWTLNNSYLRRVRKRDMIEAYEWISLPLSLLVCCPVIPIVRFLPSSFPPPLFHSLPLLSTSYLLLFFLLCLLLLLQSLLPFLFTSFSLSFFSLSFPLFLTSHLSLTDFLAHYQPPKLCPSPLPYLPTFSVSPPPHPFLLLPLNTANTGKSIRR